MCMLSVDMVRHVIGEKKISDTFFGMHNLSQLGVGGRCKPPSGVRGGAPEANAYWQQSTENCRIIIYLYNIGAQNSWCFLEVT